MPIELRDYQTDMIARTREALRRHRRVLLQAPTGAGKTAIGSFMTGTAAAQGRRVMFLVHRVELLRQTADAFEAQGIRHDTIEAGRGFNPHRLVHVAAIQTLANRLGQVQRPDLLIVDEAHHAVSPSWAKVVTALSPGRVVGLSATPCRLDGRGLSEQFDALVPGPSVASLIARGFLSPFRVFAPSTVDLAGVRTVGGDYNRGQLAEAVDRPTITGDAVSHYLRLAPGRRNVVFCASIAHAEHVRDAFRDAGVPAAAVDGSMDRGERTRVLADFAAGRLLVLTSCDLVSEGFDLPAIEVATLLRPTQSLSLYIQQVGRCLRTAPGKAEAIILDHVGAVARHGFPDDEREWSLAGRPRKERDTEAAPPVRQCKTCFHVHRPAPVCPSCGTAYPVQSRQVHQVSGELVELDRARAKAAQAEAQARARREVGRAQSREELEAVAAARGYKPGWVDYILNARSRRA